MNKCIDVRLCLKFKTTPLSFKTKKFSNLSKFEKHPRSSTYTAMIIIIIVKFDHG